MITINNINFNKIPTCCYECASFLAGTNDKKGFCVFFEKQKSKYNNIPKRCSSIFEKGFKIGGDLCIVINEKILT